jgi:hypothetical protein
MKQKVIQKVIIIFFCLFHSWEIQSSDFKLSSLKGVWCHVDVCTIFDNIGNFKNIKYNGVILEKGHVSEWSTPNVKVEFIVEDDHLVTIWKDQKSDYSMSHKTVRKSSDYLISLIKKTTQKELDPNLLLFSPKNPPEQNSDLIRGKDLVPLKNVPSQRETPSQSISK